MTSTSYYTESPFATGRGWLPDLDDHTGFQSFLLHHSHMNFYHVYIHVLTVPCCSSHALSLAGPVAGLSGPADAD